MNIVKNKFDNITIIIQDYIYFLLEKPLSKCYLINFIIKSENY